MSPSQRAAAERLVDNMNLSLETWIEQAENLLRELAAEPVVNQQMTTEPVAHLYVGGDYGDELQDWEINAEQGMCDKLNEQYYGNPQKLPLYTHPPQQRKPLTREQIKKCADEAHGRGLNVVDQVSDFAVKFTRAIERAHGITGAPT